MRKLLIILLILSLVCFSLVGCSNNDTNFSELSSDDQNGFIWEMAKTAVKDNLKSPSTAKFPTYNNATIKSEGNNVFTISSYVDAQNGFGATIRSNFIAKIKVNDAADKGGYNYSVQDVKILSK